MSVLLLSGLIYAWDAPPLPALLFSRGLHCELSYKPADFALDHKLHRDAVIIPFSQSASPLTRIMTTSW